MKKQPEAQPTAHHQREGCTQHRPGTTLRGLKEELPRPGPRNAALQGPSYVRPVEHSDFLTLRLSQVCSSASPALYCLKTGESRATVAGGH